MCRFLQAISQDRVEKIVYDLACVGALLVVFAMPLLGPGTGESSPPVGSPYTTVTGAVLAQAFAGAKQGVARAITPAKKTPENDCRSNAETRLPFIFSSNFPAGEGSGRGRPAAIPWPGARVWCE